MDNDVSFFDHARASLKQAPPWLLAWAAGTVLLLVLRFSHWDGVPFVNDEAAFLSKAQEEVATGQWVSVSPIAGTQGMRYGPSVLWFYAVTQIYFGEDARSAIAAMCLVVTLAHALALLGIARAFALQPLELLGLSAFVASSSYQLFWSRLAWDQLVNVCGSLLLLLLSSATLSAWHALVLGLVIGIALSSHLFSVPLIACTFFVLLFEHRRQPRRAALIGTITTATVLLINLPYLSFLLSDDTSRPALQSGTLSLAGSWSWFSVPAEVSGFAGFAYFFDTDWARLVGQLGRSFDWLSASQAPHVLSILALIGLCFGAPAAPAGATSTPLAATRLVRLSLVTWATYTLFYDQRDLTHHPHYTFPYWWVIPVGLASLLVALRRVSLPLARLLLAAIALVAVAQLAFMGAWRSYVDAEGGTRGIHYATPVSLQYRALASACARPERVIRIENQTVLFAHALTYVASTEPACRDKQVEICAGKCAPAGPGAALVRLVYAEASGGKIAVQP
jgi:hypothetical protein